MNFCLGLSLIIACIGLSLAAPSKKVLEIPMNTMVVQHVENTEAMPQETESQEVNLGTIVFKPNPGLFHDSGTEKPLAVEGAGEFLVAGAEIVNPQKNIPQAGRDGFGFHPG